MHEPKNTHKALGRVVHEAELEPALVEKRLGQSSSKSVRRQRRFLAVLELREQFFQGAENARFRHTDMAHQIAKAASENVEMPQHLEQKENIQ